MKRITKKAWFGKKLLGWGYRPISLEGWLVTVVFIIAIIADSTYNHNTTKGHAILAILIFLFLIVSHLTGDAPGSVAWDKLKSKKKEN